MQEREDDIILDLSDYEIVAQTDAGICLKHTDGDETWLPFSEISVEEENGIIRVPLWLAKKVDLA